MTGHGPLERTRTSEQALFACQAHGVGAVGGMQLALDPHQRLSTAGLFIFLGAWSEYTYALMFILDVHSDIETMPVALVTAGGSWGLLSAACEVVVVPVILVVWLFQNRIVAGLTAGALKG